MVSLLTGALIGAALAATAGGGHGEAADRPVTLVTEPTGEGLLVRVIGQSSVDVSLRYQLELSGNSGGGNRVNQGGAAALEGGDRPRTLATIRISGSDPQGRLFVEIDGRDSYEQLIGHIE